MEDYTPPSDVPESEAVVLGCILESPDNILRRVRVVQGAGAWAYWKHYPIRSSVRSDSDWEVIADTIFAPHAPHFAGGFQRSAFGTLPEDTWLIVKGWTPPPPERKIYVEDEDEGLPRLERR